MIEFLTIFIQNYWLIFMLTQLAVFLVFVLQQPESKSYLLGLKAMIYLFYLSTLLWIFFDQSYYGFQFFYYSHLQELQVCNNNITISFDINTAFKDFVGNFRFDLGVDGISLFFIILTTFIFPLTVLTSTTVVTKDYKFFIFLMLIIEFFLIIAFSVLDLFFFFVAFESILIPMFILILFWGSSQRRVKAAFYFFLYTAVLSTFLLMSIILIYFEVGSTHYLTIVYSIFSVKKQLLLWFFFFLTFSSKIPMFPFHIWLPEAHVEAPTFASILLASLLLKLGGYGFLRFLLPSFSYANNYFLPFLALLATIGIIYCSFIATRQVDLKKIVAYSSIAHMNLSVLSIFSNSIYGLQGGLLMMLGHGFVSSALFFLVGVLYDRYHTRMLYYYGGLSQVMPLFSSFFLFFQFSNIGFPGTINFVAEFLSVIGVFLYSLIFGFLLVFGFIFSVIYSIWTFTRVCYGQLVINNYIDYYIDLTYREFTICLIFCICSIYFGLQTSDLMDPTYTSLTTLLRLK